MQIIWPLFAMVMLTIIIIFRLGVKRYTAVRNQRVNPKFYRLYRGYEEPDDLVATSRHVINLFETPVLFYVAGILIYVTDQVTWPLVLLAWGYVLMRYAHTVIHLTSNKLLIRFRLFLVSLLFLAVIWSVFAAQLLLG
ncbi:MAG: MAPEG family protein [Gammaproteobacteria bacterium]|jgi:hypothetical protein|nr:hypothetical protein [Chromatiales bacterium]MDP6673613.1 MAPEG family protein [Gammaproteobacteria bacterium]